VNPSKEEKVTDSTDEHSQKEAIDWGKRQLEVAIDKLGDFGVVSGPSVEARVTWMLPFQMFIAELRETGRHQRALWIIGGEVPTDYLDARFAESPREAGRYFALRWQMYAAQQKPVPGDTTTGSKLADQAESLYALVDIDNAWT